MPAQANTRQALARAIAKHGQKDAARRREVPRRYRHGSHAVTQQGQSSNRSSAGDSVLFVLSLPRSPPPPRAAVIAAPGPPRLSLCAGRSLSGKLCGN
jgi:hypothetical protein